MTPPCVYLVHERSARLERVAIPSFTRVDYDKLPEDLRVELIGGELLKMASPTFHHQDLVLRIADALQSVAASGTVFIGPVDFTVDDASVLVPDVVALEAPPPRDASDTRAALLVVEVLSPSTATRDRSVKADMYLEAGVREVWLVDPTGRTVDVRPAVGATPHGPGATAESHAVPGFRLAVDDLFL